MSPEDIPNPYGDEDCLPDTDTVESYAVNNLRYMGQRALQELASFLDDLPEPVVRHGIDNALDSGKRTWSYVRAILNGYAEADVRTVQEASEVDKKHNEKYSSEGKARSAPKQKTGTSDAYAMWNNVPWS